MPVLSRLKDVRERKAKTQRELAVDSGVSQTTIVQIEAHGKSAHPTTMRKLAQALGVEPAELMSDG